MLELLPQLRDRSHLSPEIKDYARIEGVDLFAIQREVDGFATDPIGRQLVDQVVGTWGKLRDVYDFTQEEAIKFQDEPDRYVSDIMLVAHDKLRKLDPEGKYYHKTVFEVPETEHLETAREKLLYFLGSLYPIALDDLKRIEAITHDQHLKEQLQDNIARVEVNNEQFVDSMAQMFIPHSMLMTTMIMVGSSPEYMVPLSGVATYLAKMYSCGRSRMFDTVNRHSRNSYVTSALVHRFFEKNSRQLSEVKNWKRNKEIEISKENNGALYTLFPYILDEIERTGATIGLVMGGLSSVSHGTLVQRVVQNVSSTGVVLGLTNFIARWYHRRDEQLRNAFFEDLKEMQKLHDLALDDGSDWLIGEMYNKSLNIADYLNEKNQNTYTVSTGLPWIISGLGGAIGALTGGNFNVGMLIAARVYSQQALMKISGETQYQGAKTRVRTNQHSLSEAVSAVEKHDKAMHQYYDYGYGEVKMMDSIETAIQENIDYDADSGVLLVKNFVRADGRLVVGANIEIVLSEGRMYFLTGESGAGKSSLLQYLSDVFPYLGIRFVEGSVSDISQIPIGLRIARQLKDHPEAMGFLIPEIERLKDGEDFDPDEAVVKELIDDLSDPVRRQIFWAKWKEFKDNFRADPDVEAQSMPQSKYIILERLAAQFFKHKQDMTGSKEEFFVSIIANEQLFVLDNLYEMLGKYDEEFAIYSLQALAEVFDHKLSFEFYSKLARYELVRNLHDDPERFFETYYRYKQSGRTDFLAVEMFDQVVVDYLRRSIPDITVGDLAKRAEEGVSNGQENRVNLAILLLDNPDCISIDELFSGLDAESKARMIQLLKEYLEVFPRVTTIIVSHEPDIYKDLFEKEREYRDVRHTHLIKSGPSIQINYEYESSLELLGVDSLLSLEAQQALTGLQLIMAKIQEAMTNKDAEHWYDIYDMTEPANGMVYLSSQTIEETLRAMDFLAYSLIKSGSYNSQFYIYHNISIIDNVVRANRSSINDPRITAKGDELRQILKAYFFINNSYLEPEEAFDSELPFDEYKQSLPAFSDIEALELPEGRVDVTTLTVTYSLLMKSLDNSLDYAADARDELEYLLIHCELHEETLHPMVTHLMTMWLQNVNTHVEHLSQNYVYDLCLPLFNLKHRLRINSEIDESVLRVSMLILDHTMSSTLKMFGITEPMGMVNAEYLSYLPYHEMLAQQAEEDELADDEDED